MPLCSFRDAHMRADETIIENTFIREFMPSAPEYCVKVYLYGLMQCQMTTGEATVAAFAKALGMEAAGVMDAFAYWREKGLVDINEHPAFSVLYNPVRSALPRDEALYGYHELNESIQKIFAPRVATPGELSKIYDWMDIFSIEEEAIPVLLEYGRSRMKNVENANVGNQIRYIDKIASQWKEEGVRSQKDAENWTQVQQDHTSGITALMRKMGMHRAPMAAEKKLYQSWVGDGFTPKAIEAAADRMTGAYAPSFKYLAEILSELKEEGATDEKSVRDDQSEAMCKEALSALGLKHTSPTASQLRAYKQWVADGYAHETILLACEIAAVRGTRRIAEVQGMLQNWRDKDLHSVRQIRYFERKRDEAMSYMSEAFNSMGINKRPQDVDVDLFLAWRKDKLPAELILFAAESAHGAASPYRYMKRLVEIWKEEGVKTVAAARKSKQAWQKKAAVGTTKTNPALEYEQRAYQEGELDSLIDEL